MPFLLLRFLPMEEGHCCPKAKTYIQGSSARKIEKPEKHSDMETLSHRRAIGERGYESYLAARVFAGEVLTGEKNDA